MRAPELARVVTLLIFLTIASLIALTIFRTDDSNRAFALSLSGMVFLSPPIWQHAFTVPIYPLALLWQRGKRRASILLLVLLSLPCLSLSRYLLDLARPEKLDLMAYFLVKLPVWGSLILLFFLFSSGRLPGRD